MSNDEYYNDEEFLEILKQYEETVGAGLPVLMDADDLADIADYYQMKGRFEDAQRALDRALELEPDSVVALNYKVHDSLNRDDYAAAEEYLSRMIDHQLPEYIYCRAEIWIAQDMLDEADEYLRQQYEECPPEEMQDYVLDVVNLYNDYGADEKAMEWMMRAQPENSDDFKELMGRTLFGMGKYDDSERIFNELIDHDPFQKRYWNALANTQFMKENYGEAVASSEYAIAIDPDDPEGLLAKANGLFRLENYEEALKYFQRYSEHEPDDEFGHLHQGTCLINLGRYREAVEALKTAAEKAPDGSPYLVEIYQELAFSYSELKEPDTAIHYIDLTDDLECDHDDMMVIRGHILLGSDRIEEAEEMFEKALDQSKNTPQTLLRIIVSFYDNHRFEIAHAMFLGYFENVTKKWKDGYSYFALCCYDMKRYDEFMKYMKIACERNPQEARQVLGTLFPEDMKPEEYYNYMKGKLKK